jgi:hypothetical protein
MLSFLCDSLRLDLKLTIRSVPGAFPKDSAMEIENIETERQKAIFRGVRRGNAAEIASVRLHPPPPPSGVFIITIYSNTILIPLL